MQWYVCIIVIQKVTYLNNYAIDTAGIGDALQRSAAAFNAAGTDLNKSIALVTTANSVVQDPASVGTMFKTRLSLCTEMCILHKFNCR